MENSKYENNAFVIFSPVRYQVDSLRALALKQAKGEGKGINTKPWNHDT